MRAFEVVLGGELDQGVGPALMVGRRPLGQPAVGVEALMLHPEQAFDILEEVGVGQQLGW